MRKGERARSRWNREALGVAVQTPYLKHFPIPDASAEERDALAALAERQLALHAQHTGGTDGQAGGPQQQIAALDREIDRRVYALYGLSEEEIALVEASTNQT